MDYRFTNDFPPAKTDEIISLISGPRLWIPSTDYPDFLLWAEKVHGQLKRGNKRAIIALSNSEIVGVLIYQKHKKLPDALELKNLTIRPDARGRYLASFLLRNAEREGVLEFASQTAICDAKTKNLAIRYFLTHHRYWPVTRTDLYGLAAGNDTVYSKKLNFFA